MTIEPTESGYLITGSLVSGRFNTASLSQSDYADLMDHCRKEIVKEFTDQYIAEQSALTYPFLNHPRQVNMDERIFQRNLRMARGNGAKWLRDQINNQQ